MIKIYILLALIIVEENKKYSKCPLCGFDLKDYYGK